MERRLFLSPESNKEIEDKINKLSYLPAEQFQKEIYSSINQILKDKLQGLAENVKNNLFFVGSFARQAATLNSDVDFLLVGSFEEHEVQQASKSLRSVLRKHSLLRVESFKELEHAQDPKLLVSSSLIRSVFESYHVIERDIKNKKNVEIIKNQVLQRRKRFGFEAGKLLCDLKYGAGCQIDLNILKALKINDGKSFNEDVFFLAKLRNLIQLNFESDKFYPLQTAKVFKFFSCQSEEDFLNLFYKTVEKNRESLDDYFNISPKPLDFYFTARSSNAEIDEIKTRVNGLFGKVNSMSYHQFTVGEHLMATVREMRALIDNYKTKFNFSDFEVDVLLWAAIFHDLGKDQTEKPHSTQGYEYAKDFGKRHHWSKEKIKLVAWLSREHLTLARHAFKSDPLKDSLIERLYAKGVEGRRAELLFILTCADSKATNAKTWSDWKKDLLETVLNRVLNINQDHKSLILLDKVHSSNLSLFNAIEFSRLKMVPASILRVDLNKKISPGFKVIESEGVLWVRYFQENDDDGVALKTISILKEAGAYIHQAFFTTSQVDKSVYNFFKIETGVSSYAFEKRLMYNFKNFKMDLKKNKNSEESFFSKVQIRYIEESKKYAVISFKGRDQPRFLLSCIEVMFKAHLNILWGHAFTWGEEAEDVFGIEFDEDSTWSFLTETKSISN